MWNPYALNSTSGLLCQKPSSLGEPIRSKIEWIMRITRLRLLACLV